MWFSVWLVVPCTPNIGTGVWDCFTNSVLLDWDFSEGALNYTATALSPGAHFSTCTSNFTNCELPELQCGQMYNLSVVASDGRCSSPPSSILPLDSSEFLPQFSTVMKACWWRLLILIWLECSYYIQVKDLWGSFWTIILVNLWMLSKKYESNWAKFEFKFPRCNLNTSRSFPTTGSLTELNHFLLNFLFAPISAVPSCGRGAQTGLFHRRRPRPMDSQQGGPSLQRPSPGNGGTRVFLWDRVPVMWPRRAHVRLHLQHQRHCH